MANILLVDDDDLLRTVLEKTLTLAGHHVTQATNGREALQRAKLDQPELVLTDLIMPDKEGLETIGDLRRQHPALKIIAMSGGGRGGDSYLRVAELMGARQALQKPFSRETLLQAVDAAMGAVEVSRS